MEKYAVEWTEWLLHRVMFWETDDKRKGRILRAIHQFVMYSLLTLIIVSHTIYPALWLQTCVLFFCVLIWVQHVLTRGCVISKIEQKWLDDTVSFVDPFLDLFGVDMTPESDKSGVVIMGSTLAVFLLTLEWIGRIHHKLMPVLLKAPTLIASSIPHTPLPLSSP